MKIIFMGTPDFAQGALEAIIAAGYEVVLVVTQPDKEKGRGKEVAMSPVKESALAHGIPVFQPARVKTPESVEYLKSFDADLYVVAAFGQILSQEILDIPRLGCVNIHASLLPKYRGAAPIQQAILDGEKTTGITLMQMNIGMDTGDILWQKEIPITSEDTAGTMFDQLAKLGADMIVEAIPMLEKGELEPTVQDEDQSSRCGKINKEMGHINWRMDSETIFNLVRGLNPWPSAFSFIDGKMIKIWKVEPNAEANNDGAAPGTIVGVNKDSFVVATGRGSVVVSEVQLAGKKRMSVKDFLLGYQLSVGQVLN